MPALIFPLHNRVYEALQRRRMILRRRRAPGKSAPAAPGREMLILLLARHFPRQRARRFGLTDCIFSAEGVLLLSPLISLWELMKYAHPGAIPMCNALAPQRQRSFSYLLTFLELMAI